MNRGQFVWYELMTTDTAAARAFYAQVVGWDMRPSGMGTSDYTLLGVGETSVGGLMLLPREACDAGARPGWVGYIGVDDVDAMAAQVTAKGGRILRALEEIEGVGRFAVAADPQGAVFVLFQSRTAAPAPVAPDAVGACAWRELMAVDGPSAFDFYAAMFGWEKGEGLDMGPMGVYQLFRTGGDQAQGGMMTKPAAVPVPYWTYYFVVDAIPVAVQRLEAAGGKVVNGPMEVPGGMWIVQGLDPQGALFSLLGPGARSS
jgi:predicted enzyme related to lactoylglutathione lyase